jgi:hypothetical protein
MWNLFDRIWHLGGNGIDLLPKTDMLKTEKLQTSNNFLMLINIYLAGTNWILIIYTNLISSQLIK